MRIQFMLIAVALLFGCERGNSLSQSDVDIPSVISHDEGDVFIDFNDTSTWLIAHEFEFTNAFKEPMRLALKSKSCGCASFELSDIMVEPGGSCTLLMRMSVGYEWARRAEVVTLSTGLEYPETISFRLEASVFPRLSTRPFATSFLWHSEQASHEDMKFWIESLEPRAEALQQFSVISDHEDVEVSWQEEKVTEREGILQREFSVSVSSTLEFASGEHDDPINLTARLGQSSFPIALRIARTPAILAIPESVFLSRESPDAMPRGEVILKGMDSFEVKDVHFDSNAISVTEIASHSNDRCFLVEAKQNASGGFSMVEAIDFRFEGSTQEYLRVSVYVLD